MREAEVMLVRDVPARCRSHAVFVLPRKAR